MTRIRVTLIADGSSDRVLTRIVEWVLREAQFVPTVQFATKGILPRHPDTLRKYADLAVELYPADVLFVHRDSEGVSYDDRAFEIQQALAGHATSHVCVIPVRMTEAWFLFDEAALRFVAGNPNGRVALDLPLDKQIEGLPSPKTVLHQALLLATEASGRKLAKFDTAKAYHQLAERISSFEPLRKLPAFQQFEIAARAVCAAAVVTSS